MSTASAQTGQRKRKLDSVSQGNSKRNRLNDASSRVIRERQVSSITQDQASRTVPRLDTSIETGIPPAVPASGKTVDRLGDLDSEDDLSDSELSSDAETRSDSGTSSSGSDEKDSEEENERDHSTEGDSVSVQHSPSGKTDTTSVPAPTKPATSNSPDLRSRIANFLPQLRKANDELANAGDDRRIDAVADGQDHYIEMDLGLGVLRERSRPKLPAGEIQIRDSSTSTDSSSSSDDETGAEGSGKHLMRDLLGRKEKRGGQRRPVIQPLDDT